MAPSCETPEVRAWLMSNANPCALATNKFHTTDRALAFVEELYDAAAMEVCVDQISGDHGSRDGGPYADSRIVRLPDGTRRRWELIEPCEMEGDGEADGTCRERDDALYLWWD